MLKTEVVREQVELGGLLVSRVSEVRIYDTNCQKNAVIVTLPPQGKKLTVACRSCFSEIIIPAARLEDIVPDLENHWMDCC